MKKAVVTGANGFVGSNLCKELLNNNYQVIALHRSSSDLSSLKDCNCEFKIAELSDKVALESAFKGADVVFHIAALFREAKYGDEVYFQVNLDGTRNVFEAAISARVPKVIYCSTTGVMGDIENPPADETHPYAPGDVYQVSKLEAEKLALEYYRSGKIKGSVIRPAMIWGPGDRRLFKLFSGSKKRNLPIIGDGKTLFHFIYISDLVRAFRLAGENDNVDGEVSIIAGKEIVSIKEVFSIISEVLNVKPLKFQLPEMPVYLLAAIVEFACKPFGIEPPIFRRRVKFFTKSRAFDITKARKLLGYEPQHSFREEVKLLADWYKQHKWL